MKKLLLALVISWPFNAWAVPNSTAYVVTTCGTISVPPGPWVHRADPNNAAALTIDVNGLLCTSGSFTGTVTGTFTAAKATAAAPTYVEGLDEPLSVDLSGNLRSIITAALPAGSNVIGAVTQSAGPWSVNVAQVNGGTVATGSGAMNAQTQRTALATDSPGIITTGTAGSASSQVLTIQGISSMTPVTVTLSAGSAVIGHVITDSGSVTQASVASGGIASGAVASGAVASGAFASGSVGSGAFASGSIGSGAIASGAVASGAVASGAIASGALAVGSISNGADVALGLTTDAKSTATDTTAATLISVAKEISFMEQTPASRAVTNAGTFAVQAQPTPVTSGGLSWYNVEPAASDNHANIKNGAGQVYHISSYSIHTAAQFIRLYNAATGFNGCNSATNLVWSGVIPGASTGAGFVEDIPMGLTFSTGISICVTGAYGQTSTTNATASVMEVNVGYK